MKIRDKHPTTPISQELRQLRDELAALRREQRAGLSSVQKGQHAIGEAVRDIHANTIPPIGWIPSVVAAALIVYPLTGFIKDTAPSHPLSAVLAGAIVNTELYIQSKAMNLGIEAAGGTTAFASPLEGKLVVTSGFGYRTHPVTGERHSFHSGTDYACNVGDTVRSIREGVVQFAGEKGPNGNLIVIAHVDGSTAVYAHLDSIDVSLGEKVATTQTIGECGSTGRSTGAHLHLSMRNPQGDLVDPVTVVAITSTKEQWQYFKDTVALSESKGSGDYTADNGTYKGRYQMGEAALRDAGMFPIQGGWEAFKASPAMQERAYQLWQRSNLREARRAGVIHDGTPAWKVAGFLHAAQFGAVNAIDWYKGGEEFIDGNGTRISDYAKRGEDAFKAKYGLYAPSTQLLNAIEQGNGGADLQGATLWGAV